mmetsp:Transcript_39528/g.99649  ORF Transcript_39528/g.99649 Transcript_39528/m.99649 type:complete len:295 (-) Transcript_39528:622-1506(-)
MNRLLTKIEEMTDLIQTGDVSLQLLEGGLTTTQRFVECLTRRMHRLGLVMGSHMETLLLLVGFTLLLGHVIEQVTLVARVQHVQAAESVLGGVRLQQLLHAEITFHACLFGLLLRQLLFGEATFLAVGDAIQLEALGDSVQVCVALLLVAAAAATARLLVAGPVLAVVLGGGGGALFAAGLTLLGHLGAAHVARQLGEITRTQLIEAHTTILLEYAVHLGAATLMGMLRLALSQSLLLLAGLLQGDRVATLLEAAQLRELVAEAALCLHALAFALQCLVLAGDAVEVTAVRGDL